MLCVLCWEERVCIFWGGGGGDVKSCRARYGGVITPVAAVRQKAIYIWDVIIYIFKQICMLSKSGAVSFSSAPLNLNFCCTDIISQCC